MPSEWPYGLIYLCIEITGIAAALHAVMNTRTSQGATAWAITLVFFPLLSLPLYATFGRRRFEGYAAARARDDSAIFPIIRDNLKHCPPVRARHLSQGAFSALEKLAKLPFTLGNQVRLLRNGRQTFDAMFDAIDAAERYILIQFYIVNDDRLGRALRRRLVNQSRRGVAVYFLYDGIGSYGLSPGYLDALRDAGVRVGVFTGGGKRRGRFQINFRNHRKIVIVDGVHGFVGGHNVGDEYLGRHPRLSPWRDTHLAIRGPAVQGLQVAFTEDWYWVTHDILSLHWGPRTCDAGTAVLIVPSGPADRLDTCGLMFVHAINSAQRRVWIVSPYFVPDEAVVSALQLAALRGVDVRILIPKKTDNRLVQLAGHSFLREMHEAGVKVYRYTRGFLHQKVVLVDDEVAGIGTANLDNRSFRLNFEVTALVADRTFSQQVECMLLEDFAASLEVTRQALAARPYYLEAAARAARLFAPVL